MNETMAKRTVTDNSCHMSVHCEITISGQRQEQVPFASNDLATRCYFLVYEDRADKMVTFGDASRHISLTRSTV